MAKTKTSVSVKERYNSKAYDDVRIRLPKGKKALVEAAAEAAHESINQYVQKALMARMGLKTWPTGNESDGEADTLD